MREREDLDSVYLSQTVNQGISRGYAVVFDSPQPSPVISRAEVASDHVSGAYVKVVRRLRKFEFYHKASFG